MSEGGLAAELRWREDDPVFFAAERAGPLAADCGEAGVFEETTWREPASKTFGGPPPEIEASRWTAAQGSECEVTSVTPRGCHLVSVALKTSRVSFRAGTGLLFEGLMPSGTMQVSPPGQEMRARFASPCDFLHLHVENDFLCREGLLAEKTDRIELAANALFRDPLAEALGRSLVDLGEQCHPQYAASVSKAIVMRTILRQRNERRRSALPKWRLRRLEQYLSGNIGAPISLHDMANAAGISRMHFAAQFRAATGFRPHEYLLFRRVEQAKIAISESPMPLAEVALAVGFSAQAHFSTVFKRFTGKSPAQWKRENVFVGGATRMKTGQRACHFEHASDPRGSTRLASLS